MSEVGLSDGPPDQTEGGGLEPEAPAGELVWVAGGPVGEVSAGLRIWGDDLEPEEITRLLGCAPTRAQRKGEEVRGRYPVRLARTGFWHLRSELPRSVELAAHIGGLLDRTTDDPAVWAGLGARYRMDLFCGLFPTAWNQGLELPPDLLRRLGERGITLGLDIFSHSDEDESQQSTPP